ncbi:hypothetical protein C8A01DRAFT_36435 [Parachaetomium inaequale]|uniref:Uncharacterized protein n=1 Tax=Parachaetomium inaequale TaxID=2588326 RepID=A0AAN6SRL4_9PEZI|nr:hypothetical protein C8A01DRAFT_36435 [Parachaetomium inaequale]
MATKATILHDVLTNELGPAIRDASIVSLTDGIDMLATGTGTLEEALDTVVGRYHECLLVDKAPWVPALDVDTLVRMARITRIIRYFTDLYIEFRIQHFSHALDMPRGDWRASPTEQHQIAQALLRLQIIASIHHPAFATQPIPDYFFAKMVGLFESWELEQISEVDQFIFSLVTSFRPLDKNPPGCSFRMRDYYSDFYYQEYYPRLGKFGAKLMAAQRADDELVGKLRTAPRERRAKMSGCGSAYSWLGTSHRWLRWRAQLPTPAASLELLEVSAEDARDSPTDPPWAWVHAWDGRKVKRWEDALVPEPPAGGDRHEYRRVNDLMQSWRWLGVMFWDRERAEELLKAKVLEGCTTGWLGSYLISVENGNLGAGA